MSNGIRKLTIDGTTVADVSSAITATSDDVVSSKYFLDNTGNIVQGTYVVPVETKTVTATTAQLTVMPSVGKFLSSVTINPTPTQIKGPITPGGSDITVTPDQGKFLSGVTISAVQTESKTVTATTAQSTVIPSTGKFLSSVTINPTPTETKTVAPALVMQEIAPSTGKFLSKVTVQAVPAYNGALEVKNVNN